MPPPPSPPATAGGYGVRRSRPVATKPPALGGPRVLHRWWPTHPPRPSTPPAYPTTVHYHTYRLLSHLPFLLYRTCRRVRGSPEPSRLHPTPCAGGAPGAPPVVADAPLPPRLTAHPTRRQPNLPLGSPTQAPKATSRTRTSGRLGEPRLDLSPLLPPCRFTCLWKGSGSPPTSWDGREGNYRGDLHAAVAPIRRPQRTARARWLNTASSTEAAPAAQPRARPRCPRPPPLGGAVAMLGPHLSCCSPLQGPAGPNTASPRLHGHPPTYQLHFLPHPSYPFLSALRPRPDPPPPLPLAAPTFEATRSAATSPARPIGPAF